MIICSDEIKELLHMHDWDYDEIEPVLEELFNYCEIVGATNDHIDLVDYVGHRYTMNVYGEVEECD